MLCVSLRWQTDVIVGYNPVPLHISFTSLCPKQKRESWSDRVKKLRHVLATGVDVSDELYHVYSKGISNLPADRQYYVDSSGEIYYAADHQNQLKPV